MRLYLIRHPRPDVASGICYGVTDLTVAPDEIEQVLPGLVAVIPKRIPLFSSRLQRCTLLAGPLGDSCDCGPVNHDARLIEMDFGRWEMQPWGSIARAEIDAWANDLVDYRPGGGESVHQVAQRVTEFLTDLLKTGVDEAIVVCHAGTIRLLLTWLPMSSTRDMARRAAATAHQITYGGVVILDC